MPNYNDRRYRSEQMRREADNLMERHGLNPRTMPHVQALLDTADRYDKMNDRRGYEHDDESPDMRRGRRGGMRNEYDAYDEGMEMRRGVPGSGRRGMKNAYDTYDEDMEMRRGRSSRTGRFIRNEYEPMDTYMGGEGMRYPGPMYPHMGGSHGKHQMGFASNQSKSKDDLFNELHEYYEDFKKHQERAKQTGDPNEKEHALLELKEFASIMQEVMTKIAKLATTPEEKQYLQQMATKLQSEMR